MPTYIVCSTDNNDYGRIDHINLEPHFGCTEATIQVSNVNTLANFQVLSASDRIVFTINDFGYFIDAEDRQGMSWESVTGMLQTLLRRNGIALGVAISELHRIMFTDPRPFAIKSVTYDYQVLLGLVGREFPIKSVPYDVYVSRNHPDVPYITPTDLQWDFQERSSIKQTGLTIFANYEGERDLVSHCASPVKVYPVGDEKGNGMACNYRLAYDVKSWDTKDPTGKEMKDWCTIDPQSGTIYLADKFVLTYHMSCTVRCQLYLPEARVSTFTITTTFTVGRRVDVNTNPPGPSVDDKPILNCRKKLQFNESMRVSIQTAKDLKGYAGDIYVVHEGVMRPLIDNFPWHIDDPSIVHFIGAKTADGTGGSDLGFNVTVQAGYKTGRTRISCHTKAGLGDLPTETSIWVEVVNDQILLSRQKIEAPSVGTGISTSQMYLISNLGTDMYTNSLTEPRSFRNARVAAILNNSFSAGYPVLAAGEAPVKVNTGDLSDLSFQLCDGNFRPIKLMNPLYLTLIVNPVQPNPNEDIASFNGKLPRDKPTPREQAEQQKQQLEQQIQQREQQKQQEEKQERLLSQLSVDQQLQFLSLPPEKQTYYLSYVDRMAEEARERERMQQLILQQATEWVCNNIPPEQKMILQMLPPETQQQLLEPDINQAVWNINNQIAQEEAGEQAQQDQINDQQVQQQKAAKEQEEQQIQQAVQQEQAQEAQEAQEKQQTVTEFQLAPVLAGTS
jgi:hypothetical protein